jgi:hypothetical protein
MAPVVVTLKLCVTLAAVGETLKEASGVAPTMPVNVTAPVVVAVSAWTPDEVAFNVFGNEIAPPTASMVNVFVKVTPIEAGENGVSLR